MWNQRGREREGAMTSMPGTSAFWGTIHRAQVPTLGYPVPTRVPEQCGVCYMAYTVRAVLYRYSV